MIGCQGSGYKRTDPKIRLKSLCDTEEKHLKVQVGHLGAFSCIYLGHRRIRGRFDRVSGSFLGPRLNLTFLHVRWKQTKQ